MAFAATNIRKGTAGDLKLTAGNWTGSKGDASGTVNVEGSQLYGAQFLTNDGTGPVQVIPYTWSVSGSVITITVHNREAVTGGNFWAMSA
jgi:hypothetical protein